MIFDLNVWRNVQLDLIYVKFVVKVVCQSSRLCGEYSFSSENGTVKPGNTFGQRGGKADLNFNP